MTEIENATREMTFEEEAILYEQEAKKLFKMENPESEPPEANCIVRRGMRIIRKARAALREKQEREKARSKKCDGCAFHKRDGFNYESCIRCQRHWPDRYQSAYGACHD